MSGSELVRLSSVLQGFFHTNEVFLECKAGSVGETGIGSGGGFELAPLRPHVPIMAFARQLVLTFARLATVSESLSFSA